MLILIFISLICITVLTVLMNCGEGADIIMFWCNVYYALIQLVGEIPLAKCTWFFDLVIKKSGLKRVLKIEDPYLMWVKYQTHNLYKYKKVLVTKSTWSLGL